MKKKTKKKSVKELRKSKAKQITKRIVKKVASKTKKPVKKPKSNLSRYNQVQTILASYLRDKGIKYGKDFTKVVSQLYVMVKDDNIRYVEQNIDILYDRILELRGIGKKKGKVEFDDNFEFYLAQGVFSSAKYDDIIIHFKWGKGWKFKGSSEEFVFWYRESGLYKLLRIEYNASPVALFVITKTDWLKYVKYTIDKPPIDEFAPVKEAEPETVEIKKGEPKVTPSKAEALQKEIELEKVKLAVEEAKQKTIKEILKLKKAFPKMSLNEIKKILNL